jgi:hypothetical protein
MVRVVRRAGRLFRIHDGDGTGKVWLAPVVEGATRA